MDLALIGFVYWLYKPVLHAPFVFDDLTILNNIDLMRRVDPLTAKDMPSIPRTVWKFFMEYIKRASLQGFLALFRSRPITALSYEVNIATSGLNPYHFHLTSLGIGMLAIITFHHLLLHLTTPLAGAAGAWILATHPMATMAKSYIAGRSSLLAALFVLLAIVCCFHGWYGLAVIAVGIGLLAKEEAIVAIPIIIYLYFQGAGR